MITIAFLGADPATNFWARAEFTRTSSRLHDTPDRRRNGALYIAHFVSG